MVELREETDYLDRETGEEQRLQWAGLVERMADDRLPNRAA